VSRPAAPACEFHAYAYVNGKCVLLPLTGSIQIQEPEGKAPTAQMSFLADHPVWKQHPDLMRRRCALVVIDCVCKYGDGRPNTRNIEFAGYMVGADPRLSSPVVNAQFVGAWSHYLVNPVPTDKTYTDMTAGEMVADLVNCLTVAGDDPAANIGAHISVQTAALVTDNQQAKLTKTMHAETCRSVGQRVDEIKTIGRVECCIDWAWDAINPKAAVPTFRTYEPDKGTHLPAINLVAGKNVADAGEGIDSAGYANAVCVLGPTGGTASHVEKLTKDDGCPRTYKVVNARGEFEPEAIAAIAQGELDAACDSGRRVWVRTQHVDKNGCMVAEVWPHNVQTGQWVTLTTDDRNGWLCFDGEPMKVLQRDRLLSNTENGQFLFLGSR